MKAEGVAVVTGSSRGIGRAVALELAHRGFDVVATMRDPDSLAGTTLIEQADLVQEGRLRVQALDVTRPESINLPSELAVLVNNAGTEREKVPVEEAGLELWRELFETNFFGLVETTRRAIPLLRARGGGVICNITSSGLLAPTPFYAPYRTTKAAVSALGESLRTELAPFGIRVVEILPGPIATDMYAYSGEPPDALAFEPYRAMAEHLHESRASLAHMVTPPEEAAVAIVDAILDEHGPLRHGCDRLGRGLLDSWRASTDEEMMQGMLRRFVPGPG
ncbi:MAG: SDR family NAD(P)-dependent oxidoreductase [Acidimicrobiales bacterium]